MNILFVCTGNTCRSPMAEGLFREYLNKHSAVGFEVKSAGLAAVTGDPPSENAVKAAGELGADISAHRSQALSYYLAQWADVIVCMTVAHLSAVRSALPEKDSRVLCGGISDPYGGDLDVYRKCAADICTGLEGLYSSLTAGEKEL